MFSAVRIIRPLNVLFTLAISGLFCFLCDQNHRVLLASLAGLSAALTASSGNIINDVADVDTDKINRPQRVLPSGILTVQQALLFYYISVSFSVIIAFQISKAAFLIVLVTHLLLLAYSITLQKMPFFKNVTIAFIAGLLFVYIGVVTGNIDAVLFPARFAFLITLLREIVKDAEDREGDLRNGLTSLAILIGEKRTQLVSQTIAAVLIMVCILAYTTHALSIYYFIIVMMTVCPMLFYVIVVLGRSTLFVEATRLSRIIKLAMFAGFLAIMVGI